MKVPSITTLRNSTAEYTPAFSCEKEKRKKDKDQTGVCLHSKTSKSEPQSSEKQVTTGTADRFSQEEQIPASLVLLVAATTRLKAQYNVLPGPMNMMSR
ncbi:MAG: hypothetical protein K9L68_04040 [Spirochaetales bacterium]|nr:hypothetical protein [Spirochaetales bacterium]MCF7937748.1 hypothetical protein [Spirochaetales bacterium]